MVAKQKRSQAAPLRQRQSILHLRENYHTAPALTLMATNNLILTFTFHKGMNFNNIHFCMSMCDIKILYIDSQKRQMFPSYN